jgi:hypothetical protein
MSHYDYLGATTSSVPFVLTPTLEKDGFDSLFAAYKSAFPAGTTVVDFAKAVCAANGVQYRTANIEAWVFGLSGKRFPFSSKNNPGMYGGPKNVGYAYFGEGNKIMLPDIPRAGLPVPVTPVEVKVETPPATPPPPPPAPEAPWWKSPWVLGGGALAVVALVAVLGSDDVQKP